MNANQVRKFGIRITSIVIALCLFRLAVAGLCCKSESGCSGCIPVPTSPPGYVDAGSNIVKHCVESSASTDCTEVWIPCATITNGNLYEAGCSTVIGTITITLTDSQCDDFDDACAGG